MALLGPGIAEVDEEAVHFPWGKNIFQAGYVKAQELDIVHFGSGALLAGIIEDATWISMPMKLTSLWIWAIWEMKFPFPVPNSTTAAHRDS